MQALSRMQRGHPCRRTFSVYYITRESVSIMIEDEDGHEMVLAHLNRGDFFSEMGLLESGQRTALLGGKNQTG
jgi:CRP/FNR family transcriptional regulator, cyclic AMP receptor protein